MYESEREEDIKKLIESKMGSPIKIFLPRTAKNHEMIAYLENGMVLRAHSHVEMRRLLERPQKKGLLY